MKRPGLFKPWLLGLMLTASLPLHINSSEAHGHCVSGQDPISLYNGSLVFDVLRNGSNVGRHVVTFEREVDGRLRVSTDFQLTVTILGLPIYRYAYESKAQWCADRLLSLWAQQDDDGDRTEVRAVADGKKTTIIGPRGTSEAEDGLFPTNHWNAGVLSQSQVINTLSGEVSQVSINPSGREIIEAAGHTVPATEYNYSGDIETSVWYDDAGRWVKMRFTAKGGSVIEYRCVACGLSTIKAERD